jgi:hypothetical protein
LQKGLTMTVPIAVIQYARRFEAMQTEALMLAAELVTQSEQVSGAEAIGLDALARELEQVGKVISNYMPRIRKHVGDLDPVADEPPAEIVDLVRENEPFGDARERLWSLFIGIQNKLADNGRTIPAPTSEDVVLYARLYPHLGWLTKPGAVEIISA